MREFQDKTVLITGGSSGIGKSCAIVFLERGANVWITGRQPQKMESALAELSKLGSVQGLTGDIRKPEICQRWCEQASAGKGLDVLVNSAGIFAFNTIDETTEECWDTLIDINLKGTFFMCRYGVPELEKRGGNIVNISSDSGSMGAVHTSVYCASKGGVNLLTRALSQELYARNIRVNAVCPGDVATPMLEADRAHYGACDDDDFYRALMCRYPEGADRPIDPREVAEMVAFVASDKRKALNGATLALDFGITAGY